jgi:hypothetical protein
MYKNIVAFFFIYNTKLATVSTCISNIEPTAVIDELTAD